MHPDLFGFGRCRLLPRCFHPLRALHKYRARHLQELAQPLHPIYLIVNTHLQQSTVCEACNMSASEEPTRPPLPERKTSIDPLAAHKLERHLTQRPDKHDLIDRNILKDDSVAPSLQAAREKLQRSQLEDKLEHALQQRPKPEELVKEGILQDTEAPTS